MGIIFHFQVGVGSLLPATRFEGLLVEHVLFCGMAFCQNLILYPATLSGFEHYLCILNLTTSNLESHVIPGNRFESIGLLDFFTFPSRSVIFIFRLSRTFDLILVRLLSI